MMVVVLVVLIVKKGNWVSMVLASVYAVAMLLKALALSNNDILDTPAIDLKVSKAPA